MPFHFRLPSKERVAALLNEIVAYKQPPDPYVYIWLTFALNSILLFTLLVCPSTSSHTVNWIYVQGIAR